MDLTNIAIANFCAAYNIGCEQFTDDRVLCLGDVYGKGADEFLRNLARAWGGQVYFYNHDDPSCSIAGARLIFSADDFNVYSYEPTGLMQVIGFWDKDSFMSSCALFTLGQGSGLRRPELKYDCGPAVSGEYPVPPGLGSNWSAALADMVRDENEDPLSDEALHDKVIEVARKHGLSHYETAMLWSACGDAIGY